MDGPRTRQHISFELEHNLMGLKKLKLESKTKKRKENNVTTKYENFHHKSLQW